jgi:hypothetical protein
MRTRHGTAAPTRTHCAHCDGPLTRRQVWRRRTHCSKACAKAAEWRRRPDVVAKAVARSQAVIRQAFVRRLRAFLLACPSPLAAGRRGYTNGWGAARRRALAAGHPQPRRTKNPRRSQVIADLVVDVASKADAYRGCYAEGWAQAWLHYAGRRPAAA